MSGSEPVAEAAVVIGASRLRLAVATSSGLRPDDFRNRRTAQDDPE